MRKERFIPNWLCWFLGHELVTQGRLTHDECRCGCGANVEPTMWLYGRMPEYRSGWRWTRFCRWLFWSLP